MLFVSAGALTLYLTAGVGDVFSTPDYDIEYNYYPNDEDSMDSAQLLRQLSAAAHVTEGAATTAGYVRTSLPASDLHAQALAASANSGIDVEGDAVPMDVYVAFYDDASFTRFAQSLGLNPADYSDPVSYTHLDVYKRQP